MRIYHLVEAESLWALSQRGAVNLPQVKELQDRLRAAGHNPGPSDGWYGRNTANAVRAYQQANNLTVDGDAGPQTLASLGMGGANNTPPRETPPEQTPPPPAPRQPAAEPPDQPASEPAPTRREPESEPEDRPAPTRRQPETRNLPYSNLRINDGTVTFPRDITARSLRDMFRQITEIDLTVTNSGRPLPDRPFMIMLQAPDVDESRYDYSQRREIGTNIINFLRNKITSPVDIDLSVSLTGKNGGAIINSQDIILDASDSEPAPTRREPEPEPAPTRREPRPEASESLLIDLGDLSDRRLIRNSINELGQNRYLRFRFDSLREGRGYSLLRVVLNDTENWSVTDASIYRPTMLRANRTIENLRQYLRGDGELRVFVMTETGTPIASSEIFLDPMPTQNETIQRLSKLAGL